MNKINYQSVLDNTIKKITSENRVPTLIIHSCCAPCSSYVLEYLSRYFKITVLYYNPNIFPKEEYEYRISEQERLIDSMQFVNDVKLIASGYTPEDFYSAVKGNENEPEGGKRCRLCFNVRLRYTAALAKKMNFDYFTTTLSISPLKNAEVLNKLGAEIGEEYGVEYLQSDFKKRNGYKRSVELSKEYGLYRQDYCGCIYSKMEREKLKQS
ncbi:MAG: epoxyqueuosine reductase QueH [Lachnospiraceae bacterium]